MNIFKFIEKNSYIDGYFVTRKPLIFFGFVTMALVACGTFIYMFLIGFIDSVKTCNDFDSWVDAQKAYDRDPIRYARLNGDANKGDKTACESLRRGNV